RLDPFDFFLQVEAQGGQVGDWLGNRGLGRSVKTGLPKSFHGLMHVPAVLVFGINLADQETPSALDANINAERAVASRMPPQHLYANFLRNFPDPPRATN